MEEKTKKLLEQYKQYEKEWSSKTPEERIKIEEKQNQEKTLGLKRKEFKLKKWAPPKYNLGWSHDHCVFCQETISKHPEAKNEGYVDAQEYDWICKECFEKYMRDKLN